MSQEEAPPSSGPPPGLPPPEEWDYEANLGPEILAAVWGLTVMATLFMALRIYCKQKLGRGLWWDDWFMLAATIMVLLNGFLTIHNVSIGLGKHVYAVDPAMFARMGLAGNIAGTSTILAMGWSKTGFAITMLRVTDGWVKAAIWFIIVTMNIMVHLTALFTWIQCTPITKSYNPAIPGSCWDPKPLLHYNIFVGSYSAAMDIALALLPCRVIWKLQMKRKEKIGVAIAMSMGLFSGATAIMKSIKLPTMYEPDFTYNVASIVKWGTAEPTVTIVAASIPVLRVLFKTVGASTNHNRTTQTHQNTVKVTGGSKRRTSIGGSPADDRSEKSLVDGRGAIVRTDAVQVDYQKRNDTDSYEMSDVEGGFDARY